MNDIENFHFINDTYGYQMGNDILNAFFDAINAENHEVFTCRYHSDIFVSIADITGLEADAALAVIQQRCRRIAEQLTETYPIGSCVINIGACPLDGSAAEPEEYISHANLARRTAKQDYGHICCAIRKKWRRMSANARKIIHSFRAALAAEEFQLYFQPKVSCKSGMIESAEVLVRWQLADGTLRMPGYVRSTARAHGIQALDYYIYDKTFAWLAAQPRAHTRTLPVPLVPPHSFRIRKLRQLMQRYQVAPNMVFRDHRAHLHRKRGSVDRPCIATASAFRMDDLAPGYSSLSGLKDINFDKVFRPPVHCRRSD